MITTKRMSQLARKFAVMESATAIQLALEHELAASPDEAMLTAALKALVELIDGGVTTQSIRETERDAPSYSALRYARETLRYVDRG
jgi:hypothetical protein